MEHHTAPSNVIVQVKTNAFASVDERISMIQIIEEDVLSDCGGKQFSPGGLTRRTKGTRNG
jgi:hypothetical protein